MNQILLTHIRLSLTLFIAHYRQAPLQAAAILLGIILAVTLFVAVQAINLNAKRSYEKSIELLSAEPYQLLIPLAGKKYLSDSFYFSIRQKGLSQSLPILEGRVRDELGQRWKIQGIGLIAATSAYKNQSAADSKNISLFDSKLPISQFIAGEPIVMMSQSLHESIEKVPSLRFDNVKTTIVAVPDDWQLGNRLVMDIGFAQRLLGKEGQLSYIALLDNSISKEVWLPLINNKAKWINNTRTTELKALTQSFHLNLTAMSLLAFLVGLFIAYNGVKYSLIKRNRLLVQIKQAGITQKNVLFALLLELTLVIFIGACLGFWAGIQLSHLLYPSVALTLQELYGATILPVTWQWRWWLEALLFTLVTTHIACWQHCKATAFQPLASQSGFYSAPLSFNQNTLFVVAIMLTLMSILGLWQSKQHNFTMLWLGVLVVAIPLYLPLTLSVLASWFEKRSKLVLIHYLFAELKELIAPLSLAMMALLLAVTANIGMNSLVSSFEFTLTQWLERKLHADIYLSPAQSEMQHISRKLEKFAQIDVIYKQYYLNEKIGALPILLGTKDNISLEQTMVFQSKLDEFWSEFYQGELVAISEPTAIKLGLSLGSPIAINALADYKLKVGAIFYDYGAPHGEVLIAPLLWQKSGFPTTPRDLGLKLSRENEAFYFTLAEALNLHPSQIFNQSQLKSTVLTIFSQTFAITKQLNAVTLFIAAIGLFCSCFMLLDARKAAIARLYSLGVSRQKLMFLMLGQIISLVSFTLIIALPLGALVGYILTDVITLRAFGWSLHFVWSGCDVFMLIVTALFVAVSATFIPLWRLVSKPIISSLQAEVL